MRFTDYAKDGCPYCTKIIKVLDMCNLTHNVYYLDKDFTTEQFLEEFGRSSSFPQITLNGEHTIGGCVETINFLKENKFI